MQAVGVLGRIDPFQDPVGIQVLRHRQPHDVAVAGRIRVELVDDGLDLARVASAGSSRWIEFIPIASDCLCFIPTYSREAGSAPTSTVAMPGTTRSRNAATRSASSALISAAAALPSRIFAVMSRSFHPR